MMFLLTSLALAGERSLELTFTNGDTALVEGTYVLPAQPDPVEVDIDGAPHLVTTTLDDRHDTVRVKVVIDELKGKKKKPKEWTTIELTLYEDYPGEISRDVDGHALALEAVWTDLKPRKARLEVPETPAEEAPAEEAPAEEPPAEEAPAEAPE